LRHIFFALLSIFTLLPNIAFSVAEDLNVSNMMIANDLGSYVYDLDMFSGGPHRLSTDNYKMVWNQEMRNNHLGHMVAHNQLELVAPLYSGFIDHPDETSNLPDSDLSQWDVPNADWADKIHVQHPDAFVAYAHPIINLGFDGSDDFAKINYDVIPGLMELPIDVALGKVDGIEILSYPGNNRDSTLFWYKLLNTGHKLPATAGTDTFVGSRLGPYSINTFFSLPPGGLRAYVYIPEEDGFSYENWVINSKMGRTFVTNGPMLTDFHLDHIETGEIKSTGGEFQIDDSYENLEDFSVNFSVTSLYPVKHWRIIVNGRTYLTGRLNPKLTRKFKNDRKFHQFTVSKNVRIAQSSWVAIELLGDNHDWVLDGKLNAHSSPIYISINNEPQHSPEDAAYMVRRISRDMHYLSQNGYFKPGSDQKERILLLFKEGCHLFEAQQNETNCP